MLQAILSQYFQLELEEPLSVGRYETGRINNQMYMLVPVSSFDEDELSELAQLSTHVMSQGDRNTCQFLQVESGESVIESQQGKYVVLTCMIHSNRNQQHIGRKLSKFHYRGRTVPFQTNKINRIGNWKLYWEKRLDQMEKVWNDLLYKQPDHEFERLFLEAFPYYMGLAENAIQYLVDTEIDDDPQAVDSGTICHVRFKKETWGNQYMIKNPFDWVFDHGSRDLAEWTRDRYFTNIKLYEPEVSQFFQDYQTVMPLSSFSWRLVYARLLFPLHFFDNVENYYITSSEQEKNSLHDRLVKSLAQTKEHEEFLSSFYQLAGVPVRRMKIPKLDWL
jgi:spore coat protein YutH